MRRAAGLAATLIAVTACASSAPANRLEAVPSRPAPVTVKAADVDLYTPETLPTTTTTVTVPVSTKAAAAPVLRPAALRPAVLPAARREIAPLVRVTPKPWKPRPVAVTVPVSGIWACIVYHESRGDPTAVNPRSGASGLVGFLDSTWRAMGMTGKASQYPAATQMAVAYRLQAKDGWAPWHGDGCV